MPNIIPMKKVKHEDGTKETVLKFGHATCPVCGQDFIKVRAKQRYDKYLCRNRDYWKKKNKEEFNN
jgi:formylmethanofuran dehydrogenase subunit E